MRRLISTLAGLAAAAAAVVPTVAAQAVATSHCAQYAVGSVQAASNFAGDDVYIQLRFIAPIPDCPATSMSVIGGGRTLATRKLLVDRTPGWNMVSGTIVTTVKSFIGLSTISARFSTGETMRLGRVQVFGQLANREPVIIGNHAHGHRLRASLGRWTEAWTHAAVGAVTVHYRWYSGDRPIAGAVHSTFTPSAAYRGHQLRVRVSAAKPGYTGYLASSMPVTIR